MEGICLLRQTTCLCSKGLCYSSKIPSWCLQLEGNKKVKENICDVFANCSWNLLQIYGICSSHLEVSLYHPKGGFPCHYGLEMNKVNESLSFVKCTAMQGRWMMNRVSQYRTTEKSEENMDGWSFSISYNLKERRKHG